MPVKLHFFVNHYFFADFFFQLKLTLKIYDYT